MSITSIPGSPGMDALSQSSEDEVSDGEISDVELEENFQAVAINDSMINEALTRIATLTQPLNKTAVIELNLMCRREQFQNDPSSQHKIRPAFVQKIVNMNLEQKQALQESFSSDEWARLLMPIRLALA